MNLRNLSVLSNLWKHHRIRIHIRKSTSKNYSVAAPYTAPISCTSKSVTSAESNGHCSSADEFKHLSTDSISAYFRNMLYQESTDPVICRFKSCMSVNEVFEVINLHGTLNIDQLIQCILVLRDIQRLSNTDFKEECKHHRFEKILQMVDESSGNMSANELSICIFYLHKMCKDEGYIKSLVTTFDQKVVNMDELELSSLARVFVPMKETSGLWSILIQNRYIPFLKSKLEICDDLNDFRKITICFQKAAPLLNDDMMKLYIDKLWFMLAQDTDTTYKDEDRFRTYLRVVTFLNFKIWKGKYSKELRQLFINVQGMLHFIDSHDLTFFQTALNSVGEPYALQEELKELAKQKVLSLLNKPKECLTWINAQYMARDDKQIQRQQAEQVLTAYCAMPLDYDDFMYLGDIFFMQLNTGMTILNGDLMNLVWTRSIDQINSWMDTTNKLVPVDILHSLIAKYINWKKSTGLSHEKLETNVKLWLLKLRTHDFETMSANERCVFHLLTMYFFMPKGDEMVETIQDLQRIAERLHPTDSTFTSQLFLNVSEKAIYKRDTRFVHHYVNLINSIHNKLTEHLKKDDSHSTHLLRNIFTIYVNNNGNTYSELYQILLEKINNLPNDMLTSQFITKTLSCFAQCNQLEPSVIEKFIDYCIERKDIIHSRVYISLISTMFMFGYTPKKIIEILNIGANSLYRDKDLLLPSSYVSGVLALCYYNFLPANLIKSIFNVEFLQELDNQLTLNSKKNVKVNCNNNLLQLNRAVCIDFPHYNLPWFHDRFCKDTITLFPHRKSNFHNDVLKYMKEIVKNDKALQENAVSPYYHQINLLLTTNKNGVPVDKQRYSKSDMRKIAVLLNSCTRLGYCIGKGKIELTMRQLEVLGYKVVKIDEYVWNSMYMSEPAAKVNYLCDLIWSKGSDIRCAKAE